MDKQAIRARLLEDLRQSEARLRALETAYFECKHTKGSDTECLVAYQAVLVAVQAADAAYDRYLAADQEADR